MLTGLRDNKVVEVKTNGNCTVPIPENCVIGNYSVVIVGAFTSTVTVATDNQSAVSVAAVEGYNIVALPTIATGTGDTLVITSSNLDIEVIVLLELVDLNRRASSGLTFRTSRYQD